MLIAPGDALQSPFGEWFPKKSRVGMVVTKPVPVSRVRPTSSDGSAGDLKIVRLLNPREPVHKSVPIMQLARLIRNSTFGTCGRDSGPVRMAAESLTLRLQFLSSN